MFRIEAFSEDQSCMTLKAVSSNSLEGDSYAKWLEMFIGKVE